MSTEKRLPSALPTQYRAATIDAKPEEGKRLSGEDPGRFRFSVSSDEPYLRWFGNEILVHDKGAIRTGRLDAGLVPNNFNHDPDRQLGIVDNYEIKDGRMVVEGPFSRSAFAQEKRQDYDDGILKAASIGYRIHKMVRTEDEDNPNAPDECRVTDWEPFDASLVTVPADATVGVGRAVGSEDFPVELETISRRSAAAPATETAPQPKQEIKIMAETAVIPSVAELELARQNEIMAVATDKDFRKYVSIDETKEAIDKKTSANDFKDAVARKIVAANDVSKVGTAADQVFRQSDKKDQRRYSVTNFIRSLVNEAKAGTFPKVDATFEREMSAEIAKRLKISTSGPLIPLDSIRALGTAAIGSGSGQIAVSSEAAAVETITRPEVIELLRNRPRAVALGARVLGGLQGVIRLPRQTAAATAYWLTEGAGVTESDLTMDYVTLSPKRYSMQTAWTIELLAEMSPDVEALARADMAKVRLLGLDLASISGTGSSNGQPQGLLGTTGLTFINPTGTKFATSGADDGAQPLTFTDILSFESNVAAANADVATSGWMFTPEVRAQLKNTLKFPSAAIAQGGPIWGDNAKDPDGLEVGPLGYKAGVTNQLPKTGAKVASYPAADYTANALHTAIFGDFSQMIFADWGAVEVVVDPYTQAGNGAIVVTQRSLHDIAIRHILAFCASKTIGIS